MKITASNLIRWAGLSAEAAGILFVVIQPVHPPDFFRQPRHCVWTGRLAAVGQQAGWP
jgi:hypothetical protein